MTPSNNPASPICFTADALARKLDGRLHGDAALEITGALPFELAGSGQVTLAGTPAFLSRLSETHADAAIVPTAFLDTTPDARQVLIAVENPRAAFAKALRLFHPRPIPMHRISPRAVIGDDAVIGSGVRIDPLAVIGSRANIADGVRIHSGAVIGDDVVIGEDSEICPNVTIRERCLIGRRVLIHSGTVIGSDGFGFAPDGESYQKIPHTGIVQIDDDVEIGALNAIDRATFGKTHIHRGVKTDNLVHVAHNVTVGENTLLVAQVGISGSTTIGKHAVLAGQAGVSQHLTIGDGVVVGPQSGIGKSIADGEVVSGSPEMPHRLWLKVQRLIPRLPELRKKIMDLEKRLAKVENP